jgi:hypothetical protein
VDGGREGPAIDLHGVHAARGHRQQLCAEKAFGDLSRLENLDQRWVRGQQAMGRVGELVCGAGYDAVCSTALVRQGRHAYLTLSATNPGYPLIHIGASE